jgi:hypothetical protein
MTGGDIMKDKLKNTLEHEVELLGRSISVLALAGLLLIGGGSAALLTSFGTVQGEATVDQSVVIDGETTTDTSGPTVETDFSDVVAGSFDSVDNPVENNLDQPIETMVDTSEVDGEDGVNPAHFFYIQSDNSYDGSEDFDPEYGVDVDAVSPISDDSTYAAHLEGEDTVDYATLYYAVDGLDSDDEVKFDYEELDNHQVGQDGLDEVYLYDSEGNQYQITGSKESTDGTVTVDLSDADWYEDDGPDDNDYSEIVAVGIGYGDASAAFPGEDGTETTVNITVDNVRAG